ncbi:50S ribosomal protein L13 [Haliovirga abyssi]|uniref:Large ribosomal subunit protein uL13 n=2 Tax=Haliovirga abyssi TaxID=2996794 RepID=A0AAU9DWV1_9FUSO|nr:50S ribosomal protein L13 [Haliovirga abyssi]
MKTFMLRKEDTDRKWYEVDAEGKILGRMATEIAMMLMGKKKPTYTPHVDNGDFVVVVNAEKIVVTGAKLNDKIYYNHSGYPGGLRDRTLAEVISKKPEEVIMLAVKRMLPKSKLGNQMLTKLKVFAGPSHPHMAQKPEKIEL